MSTKWSGGKLFESSFEEKLWRSVSKRLAESGLEVPGDTEAEIRDLVRRAATNVQETGGYFKLKEPRVQIETHREAEGVAGFSDAAFSIEPEPARQAEVAFLALVATMRAVARSRGAETLDISVYRAAYAGLCPCYPIC